ncbi:Asp-tRNA(Asn)/Glu-tRNA(Gln) amidotransferase subunit GatC [Methanoculleus sp. FWC-SCC1]|uniref:Aspartyl/glutamyl-tRNA(Asn/Gln) amidotransferase subunit C n=1 Tax=Methanoculleus frigidifontis TaxID=2584085 RepID=A0ABT8MCR3_9EURY|nr:Asp-tRNA(Asn)/Glu-tRNA(Gln) amidotransferase subunit GatC [Methanoculleus sp. FWC-SCC1]MDN7025725.1 Asp-tRNA(Asn)/Glu-tRNA(Gln) amidotransferase subunit GatC [Methanoculleus sp. FWC-SCC1]
MVSEIEIESIAKLADIDLARDEVAGFTREFNAILEYFDALDQVSGEETLTPELTNVFREDEPGGCLPQEDVLANAGSTEDGFVKAPRVM